MMKNKFYISGMSTVEMLVAISILSITVLAGMKAYEVGSKPDAHLDALKNQYSLDQELTTGLSFPFSCTEMLKSISISESTKVHNVEDGKDVPILFQLDELKLGDIQLVRLKDKDDQGGLVVKSITYNIDPTFELEDTKIKAVTGAISPYEIKPNIFVDAIERLGWLKVSYKRETHEGEDIQLSYPVFALYLDKDQDTNGDGTKEPNGTLIHCSQNSNLLKSTIEAIDCEEMGPNMFVSEIKDGVPKCSQLVDKPIKSVGCNQKKLNNPSSVPANKFISKMTRCYYSSGGSEVSIGCGQNFWECNRVNNKFQITQTLYGKDWVAANFGQVIQCTGMDAIVCDDEMWKSVAP